MGATRRSLQGRGWIVALSLLWLPSLASAQQTCGGTGPTPVPPLTDPDTHVMCHPSVCTPGFCGRGDIAPLGALPKLQERLVTLDCSPHSAAPVTIFAEAPGDEGRSRLFQYYLLDSTSFQPSVFTTKIPNLNDDPETQKTVWGANCNLSTIGAVRLALEPKAGLPTDPDDPRAFIDVFTDIRSLFVINNESGWYEGWMIHDLRVAAVAPPNSHGHARIGMITAEDAKLLALMGQGNNAVAGRFFTVDGRAPRLPSHNDHFPDHVSNLVPIQLSMGAYNALQQSDVHAYWEFNYTTNWIHPLYELPVAGGFPDRSATEPADTYRDGEIARFSSVVPGEELNEVRERSETVRFGDNPDRPRDADRFEGPATQREFRQRFIPSGIAREVFLNVFERLASFEPWQRNLQQRLVDGYKAAIALVDSNHDGIISAEEGDIDTPNANCPQKDNTCIYLIPRSFNRFAVTRELNDGLLAPRFAPSTRAWALAGTIVTGFPVIPASVSEDSDDR